MSPSDPPSSFTLSPNRTGHPFVLCCVYGCCSPACAVCSSPLGLGSGWPLPLHCPPLTWWHNHAHPCRPSPSVSCKPSLSPRLPCTHIGRLWTAPASELPAPVALFCLGSDVSLPRGGTCPLSHTWVPEPAGVGGAGWVWGLGARSGGCSCWHHGVPGPVLDTSAQAPSRPLSTQEAEPGSKPLCRGGSHPHPGCPGPQLPWLCPEHK